MATETITSEYISQTQRGKLWVFEFKGIQLSGFAKLENVQPGKTYTFKVSHVEKDGKKYNNLVREGNSYAISDTKPDYFDQATQAPTGGNSKNNSEKPNDIDKKFLEKDLRILRESALNSAVVLMSALVAKGFNQPINSEQVRDMTLNVAQKFAKFAESGKVE
jgi:hypothetical protein